MSNRLIIDGDRVAPSSHVRVSLTSCLVIVSLQPRVIPRQFVIPSRPPRGQSHVLHSFSFLAVLLRVICGPLVLMFYIYLRFNVDGLIL